MYALSRRSPLLLILGLLILAFVLSSALAASNTFATQSSAGDGAGVVAGYAISGITYRLDSADASKIDRVTFTATPSGSGGAPNKAAIGLGPTGVAPIIVDNNFTMTTGTGTMASSTLTCTFTTSVTIATATALRIILTQ